jgi:hypothetical protein
VRQRQPGGHPHVLLAHRVRAPPCRVRHRCPRDHQVRPHPVDVEGGADRRDPAQLGVGQRDRAHPGLRSGDPLRGLALLGRPSRREPGRVVLERQAPAHHLDPGLHVAGRAHLDGQPEPVEQLRAQLALLRVHRADQQEPRRVRHRHPVALDVRAPHRGRVQQQVDQVVVQEVDLVDVEDPAVRVGEQPRLVGAHPFGQRTLQVQRSDQPVLGGPHRQLDQPGRPRLRRPVGGVRPVRAGRVRRHRVAAEPASRQHGQLRQQGRQRAYRGGLGGALLPADQHPADPGVHRVEQQRQPQVVVPDHGRERKSGNGRHCAHPADPARVPTRSGMS